MVPRICVLFYAGRFLFLFSKKIYKNPYRLQAQISRELNDFIVLNKKYLDGFDKINIYYDNGQHELTKILNAVFALNLNNYELKLVLPVDYKLFQIADMVCALTLTNEKIKKHGLSRSEEYIFHSKKDFKKDFFKDLIRKSF